MAGSDGELVERCLAGDAAAFGALVERHRSGIVGFCCRRTGDLDEAQDLAQEVFLRAYFDLHALREPAKFGPWARAIAMRLCQSWHRRRRPETLLPPDLLAECAGTAAGSPDDRETPLLVRQALDALPDAQRRTLLLKYSDGYTLAEIAGLMRVPVETARTRLRRARCRLKEVWPTMMDAGVEADGGFARRVLERVELVQMESGLAWPLYACLHALGRDWSLSRLMGIVGGAFRFTVNERIADTGPTDVLDWDHWFARIGELGYEVAVFNAQLKSFSPDVPTNTEAQFRAAQAAAWEAARASLDRGVPAIAWMPMTLEQKAQGLRCECGLLVGYDTEGGFYHVRLPWMGIYTVPWDGFGRADPVSWFNVIVFGAERPMDEPGLEMSALCYAVAHAHSTRPGHGLSGYTVWEDALRSGQIQSDGSPRAARLLREAREHAAAFLREIAGHSPGTQSSLLEAGQHYRDEARAWEEYLAAFVPEALDAARDPGKRAAGIRAVEAAQHAEQAAVAALERALP